jgi:hypothetical protein
MMLGLVGFALIFAATIFNPKLDLWGDNAEFIVLARSIVQGRWMRYINQPDAPASAKFPFGFPLLLAPLQWAFPGDLVAMKRFVLVLFALSIPVVYLVMKRYVKPAVAIGITLLTVVNPVLAPFSHQVMSEVPYLLLTLAALWLIGQSEETAALSQDYFFWGGVAMIIAATCVRTIGVSLFLGTLVFYLLRRAWKMVAALAIAYAGTMLLLHLTTGQVIGMEYFTQASQVNPLRPEIGSQGLAGLPGRALQNLLEHLFQNLPKVVFGSPGSLRFLWRPSGPAGITLWGLLCLAPLMTGLVSSLLKGRLPALYLLFYTGVLLSWPTIWAVPRFLAPVVPLIFLFMAMGIAVVLRLLRQWADAGGNGAILLTGCLFALAVAAGVYGTYDYTVEHREYRPEWKSYFEAAEWLKQNSPRDSLIIARKPLLLHLASERSTMLYPFTPNHEELVRELLRRRADFVVVDRLGIATTPLYLVPAIRSHGALFEPVFATAIRPQTYVFRIRREES